MKSNELDRMIHDCLEGDLTEENARKLSVTLESSAEARQAYWEVASVHGLLEQVLQQASLSAMTGETVPPLAGRKVPGEPWRSWAAAAAGIAFGILSASVVWAYTAPLVQRQVEQSVPVLAEGFEDAGLVPGRGFPKEANRWSGDLSLPLAAESGVEPFEGDRMVRLEAPEKRRFSYAWRVLDLADYPGLAPDETQRLQVRAFFHASGASGSPRYQIRLAALSQAPTEARQIWNNEAVLFDTALQHVGRNLHVEEGRGDWNLVKAAMEIPPGTRCVVISLAAGEADPGHAPTLHYLDDVDARFVITKRAPSE